MMNRKLPFFIIFIFIAILSIFFINLDSPKKNIYSPLIGKKFPSFSVTSWQNANKNITEKIFDKNYYVVNVFASWCFTCYAEHKLINKLVNEQKISFIGINYKDKKQDAKNFLANLGNPYEEILFDPDGVIGIELGVYAVPETFLVDKDGVIVYKHIGELTVDIWNTKFIPFFVNY